MRSAFGVMVFFFVFLAVAAAYMDPKEPRPVERGSVVMSASTERTNEGSNDAFSVRGDSLGDEPYMVVQWMRESETRKETPVSGNAYFDLEVQELK